MRQTRHPDVRLVVHGHFYQPPRENPWTDSVPQQPSAQPFHDWNERIKAECYRPNTASRVLDPFGRIRAIVNNFEYMSFNIGPTLMTWLEHNYPVVLQRILEADRHSVQKHNGHGNAMAQVYNHVILPLANERDRHTQVLWGLREFEHRFGRKAEGMWLSETAIDAASVETLIEHGVRFTVLSPHQAARVRPLGDAKWRDVSGGHIDPRQPYRIMGKPAADGSPRFLDVFFYDGPISRALAFEDLLSSGDKLAERLALAVQPAQKSSQVISVAVDGETFGHHAAFGDMCLAALFTEKAQPRGFQVTNYAEYLAQVPPTMEVELEAGPNAEGTAWSCAHGVGRWCRDCGCSTGAPHGWNQQWRAPLRQALDHFRQRVTAAVERHGAEVLRDVWQARDDYVDVIVHSEDPERRDEFLRRHMHRPDDAAERVQALTILEAERNAMAMYTSCAWFFADVSGIETVQNLRYAARTAQLLQPFAQDIEEQLLGDLELVHSNNGSDTAASLYRHIVSPEVRTAERAVNARAMFRLLDASRCTPRIYGFNVHENEVQKHDLRGYSAVSGHMALRERWTDATKEISYLAIKYASRNFRCFMTPQDAAGHAALLRRVAELPDVIERAELELRLTELFGAPLLGIVDLLPAQRRRIAERLAAERVSELRTHHRAVYQDCEHLLEDYADLDLELPEELRVPCEFVLQENFVAAASHLCSPFGDDCTRELLDVIEKARRLRLSLDVEPAAAMLLKHLMWEMTDLLYDRHERHFDAIENLLRLAESTEMPLERTDAEELAYDLLRQNVFPHLRGESTVADGAFAERCLALAQRLNFAIEELQARFEQPNSLADA